MPELISFPVSPSGKMMVWKVEEESEWFKDRLVLSSALWEEYAELSTETVRHRWLASRYAMQLVVPETPLDFRKDIFGRPYMDENRLHLSLSHCAGYVAGICSEMSVGIDVERLGRGVLRVKRYFLKKEELDLLGDSEVDLMIAWSAKESLFKWLGDPRFDLKSQVTVLHIDWEKEVLGCRLLTSYGEMEKEVRFRLGEDMVLTWVVGKW